MRTLTKICGLLTLALASALASASDHYPSRMIRLVVPYSPGGSIDITARLLAKSLGDSLGQPIVVDNRPGASGNIGMDFVAKSAPDGYTLLMAPSGLTANAHLFSNYPFNPLKAFAPIARIADQPNILVTNPTLGVKSTQDLIALAKSKPGKLSFGSAGPGSTQHIAAELFMQQAGISMLHVPYKGGAPALQDVVAGQIDMMFETAPTVIQYVATNKVIGLAVTTKNRLGAAPEIPPVADVVPGYDFAAWIGLVAPANTPPEIVSKLNALVRKAVAGDLKHKLVELGLTPVGDSPSDFAAFLQRDYDYYARIVKDAKIPVQ